MNKRCAFPVIGTALWFLFASQQIAPAASTEFGELLSAVGIDAGVYELIRDADLDDLTTGDIAEFDHVAATMNRFRIFTVDDEIIYVHNKPNAVLLEAYSDIISSIKKSYYDNILMLVDADWGESINAIIDGTIATAQAPQYYAVHYSAAAISFGTNSGIEPASYHAFCKKGFQFGSH